MSEEELQARAAAAGIALHYTSFWGEHQQVPPAVLRKLLNAMGDPGAPVPPPPVLLRQGEAARWAAEDGPWQLREARSGDVVCAGTSPYVDCPDSLVPGCYRLCTASSTSLVIVAPATCWMPPEWHEGQRWWGLSAQLYALRSLRNWGIGDFTDLRDLVDIAAAQGAAFVGVSPLHALFAHQPEAATPYSPCSRLALNPLFIDVEAVPEFETCDSARTLVTSTGFQRQLHALRDAREVRYADVAATKHEVLRLLWSHFRAQGAGTDRRQRFLRFQHGHADTLGRHALWEVIQLRLHASDPTVWGWPAWPLELQDHEGLAVRNFECEHADEVDFRFWLQWLAHEQLAQTQQHARERMPVGLYGDLAVGANEGGSETWVMRGLYARGAHVGAPPDPLNRLGQDWGLPPMSPTALAAAHFEPFIALLGAAMRHAGALRMDHVMALMRLFWNTSEGGSYVRYPLDTLLAIVAVESHRHRCAVIGEDLGNVPPEMREAMARCAMLSYRPLWFERAPDEAFRRPADWPPQALAVVSTHDLPTLAGFWRGADVATQHRLQLLPDAAAHERLLGERAQDRARLWRALEQEGLLPEGAAPPPPHEQPGPALIAAVHAYLARTPCWLAAVQLEDVTGQVAQVNVPGTSEAQHPNWRHRVEVALEALSTLPAWTAVCAAMRRERDLALPGLETADIPLATYRMQFHAGHTFAQARAAVPYLAALGVSHLYGSPYLMARPGSTHGYDAVDPTRLNPEIGDDDAHAALCAELDAHGMGQVLDVVPNHMAVLEARNPWWEDVLEHGEASPHAPTFDIEWHPAAPEMQGRLLLPILGNHYGRVLAAGELQLRFDVETGRFAVHHWDHRAPIDPRDVPAVLAAAPPPTAQEAEMAEVHALLGAFGELVPRHTADAQARRVRWREARALQQRFAALVHSNGDLRAWIDDALRALNGTPGDAASFDALDALLRRQAYRLAHWRTANDDINYRRFFDINALAALRMEDASVFEATHQRVLGWLRDRKVSGLRVDHPDGLSRPHAYFRLLQQRYAAMARAAQREPRALYLVVEKILADHEPMPEAWPVHGGTGYRFSSLVNGLFVDPAGESAFDDAYESFTGDTTSFEDTVHACKKLVIDSAFGAELNWLTETLHRITRAERRMSDFTRQRLRSALAEVAAAFPVYRTYVSADTPGPSETDRQHVAWALSRARQRLERTEADLLDSLGPILLGEAGPAQALRERFVERWQQFTAPVMAKAVEDTAFYRYVRLASLNDVGAEPRRFGVSVAAFHNANVQRARHRPHWLLATSTHDSKRSEDVRARLNVLSEIPAQWAETVSELDRLGERFQSEVDGVAAPSTQDRWTLFQALVGIWPAHGATQAERGELRQRLQQTMQKAMREAKRESHWLSPNEAYEQAMERYIESALSFESFVQRLEACVRGIAPTGFRNSLAQLALKMTVPGVPDIYQGCEQWNFSLVDPDNRRPVDFPELAAALQRHQPLYAHGAWPSEALWRALLPACPGAELKQMVTWRLLQLRRAHAGLFRDGAYLPLAVAGTAGEHLLAFARLHEGRAVVVLVARLLHGLAQRGWGDTLVHIAAAHPTLDRTEHWQNTMTGEVLADDGRGLRAQDVLGDVGAQGHRLPFAVLVRQEAA
ncbi:malto-oligosyltrehalose synthase [Hydrogenophaga sp. BPS33]|uniref:malto-oligosyltrehalose synthase n=1 Tax=Hydrogenophaga sp. BPS33 TaxID=2651974 RepID=UPI00131F6654|nr:malto-oligosyltrehalose synthase [Hydrogenophaga sp. BPS33]QHE86641.1 malto-oligosyltrehalose synthase [Hydrogenophaga sp. BPS33]